MLPSASSTMLCGLDAGSSGNSFISPVAGLSRPIRLMNWPFHQIVPSRVCSGSRERWPSVGTSHSLKVTETSPPTSSGARPGLGGKWVARYWVIAASRSAGSLTIVATRSRHAACV